MPPSGPVSCSQYQPALRALAEGQAAATDQIVVPRWMGCRGISGIDAVEGDAGHAEMTHDARITVGGLIVLGLAVGWSIGL
jgi:hypothetical protein